MKPKEKKSGLHSHKILCADEGEGWRVVKESVQAIGKEIQPKGKIHYGLSNYGSSYEVMSNFVVCFI